MEATFSIQHLPQSMPIYNVSMEEARWGAVGPGMFMLVLMIRVKYYFSGQKTFHIIYQEDLGNGSSRFAHHIADNKRQFDPRLFERFLRSIDEAGTLLNQADT